jgi:hypothetical protein
MKTRNLLLLGLAVNICLFAPIKTKELLAQNRSITASGVSGHEDGKHRSPVLTASANVQGNQIQILADAFQRVPDYRDYPIQFDFFINRRLYSSQLRSKEQPGPIGIDVSKDMFQLPLHYAVLAKIITPQGNYFSSIVYGIINADGTTEPRTPEANPALEK